LMTRVTVPVLLSCGVELSVTVIVSVTVSGVRGRPLMVQLFGASVRPAGSVPEMMVQE
jgi:hypothetical protein